MAEKIIKHLLFTWFQNVPDQHDPSGNPVRVEKLAYLGQKVDVNDEVSLQRGEELGAFYTDDEAKAIEDGSYDGVDAEHVFRARANSGITQAPSAPPQITSGDSTASVNFSELSSEELGDYIHENRLSVSDTKALLPEDASDADINKLWDAEVHATDNAPRKGVTDYLDTKLAASAAS